MPVRFLAQYPTAIRECTKLGRATFPREQITQEFMRKAVATQLIWSDLLSLQQGVQGCRVISESRIATGNVNQEPGATLGKLPRHPIKAHILDMLHGLIGVTQLDSDGYLVNRHISWAKHRAKVGTLFAQFHGTASRCLENCVCFTVITFPCGCGRRAQKRCSAQAENRALLCRRRCIKIGRGQKCGSAGLLEASCPHIHFGETARRGQLHEGHHRLVQRSAGLFGQRSMQQSDYQP